MVQTREGARRNLWLKYLRICMAGYQEWLEEHCPETAVARMEEATKRRRKSETTRPDDSETRSPAAPENLRGAAAGA